MSELIELPLTSWVILILVFGVISSIVQVLISRCLQYRTKFRVIKWLEDHYCSNAGTPHGCPYADRTMPKGEEWKLDMAEKMSLQARRKTDG